MVHAKVGQIKERIVDWYLTRKTGKDKAQRTWEAWCRENIVFRATTVENTFMNFKHIIEVDSFKVLDMWHPFGYCTQQSFKQYEYPNRPLGQNAVWIIRRVRKDRWDGKWHDDELCGEDKVFVATNNDQDAVMIALRYT